MFKKTKIAAVTSAVLGLSGLAIAPSAQAVSVNENGATGQVLVFPYYNVNNNFNTSFNVTNTTDEYKAVKFRFRESNTSNDILDFNVYMSPQDIFTVALSKAADGGVTLTTSDNTCTHPAIPSAGVQFRDVYDSVENADMREGYLEVIEMGVVDETATVTIGTDTLLIASEGILHDTTGDNAGMPKNCDVIEEAWQEGVFIQGGAAANTGALHSVDPNSPGYPDNAALGGGTASDAGWYGKAPTAGSVGALDAPTGGLVGSEILIDLADVAGFVAEPISIVNYSANAQHYLSSDQNFYLLPSLASGSVLTTDNTSDDFTSTIQTTWTVVARDYGLDDPMVLPRTQVPSGINPMPMAHAMAVTSVSNQYFLEGDASTDWVLATPMRKHAIFNDYQYVAPAAGHTLASAGTGAIIIGLTADDDTDAEKEAKLVANGYWSFLDNTDVNADFEYYDREEKKDVPSVSAGDFSPPIATETPDNSVPFTREVNILALSASGSDNASVLGSDHKQGLSLAAGFENGWGRFDFSSYDLAAARYTTDWTTATLPAGAMAKGVPLAGFIAAKGGVSSQNVGETFPHIIGRTRGN